MDREYEGITYYYFVLFVIKKVDRAPVWSVGGVLISLSVAMSP